MSPGLSIADEQGRPAVREAGGFVLDEARRWWLSVPGGPCVVRLDARVLPWDAERGGVLLDLPFAVGHLDLTVERDGRCWRVPLRVRPDPSKVGEDTWEALLSDLEAWVPGLVAGAEGPRVGSVGLAGVAAPLLAEAVLPLLPLLEAALRRVLDKPRQQQIDVLEELPLHRTRAADRETVAWLCRRPREAAWLDPVRSLELTGRPPEVRQRVTRDTLDHPANRHVAWLVDRVVRRLRATADALDGHRGSQLNDTRTWAGARARALRVQADRLDRLRRHSFLRGLRRTPASEGAMLVVLDHPLYSRVHRLARRVLAARFDLAPGEHAAATRPSFDLYELWTFLAVQRVLAEHLGPGFSWRAKGLGGLLSLDGSGGGAAFVGSDGVHSVELLFNPTFPSYLRDRAGHGRYSLSTERRPDLVLTWTAPGRSRWIVFDAKYRVGASNVGDALSSAHLYRDALRWPERGGACVGAWLLCPRRTEDAAPWFDPGFHDAHGFGALELRPGQPVADVVVDRLCSILRLRVPA